MVVVDGDIPFECLGQRGFKTMNDEQPSDACGGTEGQPGAGVKEACAHKACITAVPAICCVLVMALDTSLVRPHSAALQNVHTVRR